MTTHILFASRDPGWEDYETPLAGALRPVLGSDFTLAPEMPADQVDYIVYAPNSPVQDFTGFPRLRAVLSLWAGVERIVGNQSLTVPLTVGEPPSAYRRIMDSNGKAGMKKHGGRHGKKGRRRMEQ